MLGQKLMANDVINHTYTMNLQQKPKDNEIRDPVVVSVQRYTHMVHEGYFFYWALHLCLL